SESDDFPANILTNLISLTWWKEIKQLKTLLLPYCTALNRLQRNNAKLHEILHCFGWVSKILKNLPDWELTSTLLKNLEKRWATWEQPLVLIFFLLYPKYRDTFFSSNILSLSYVYLGKWILYYYKVWFGESSQHILFELSEFSEGQYPYDEETYSQFNNDILQFWKYARSYTKELYKVAQR
ncbi:2263_t:CDS:1, partial [Acaulospora morrowiae]